MTTYLDSSVLVAALVEDEPRHESCLRLLRGKRLITWTHGLGETFATLTGGRLGIRVSPAVAAQLIEDSLLPRLRLVELRSAEVVKTIRSSSAVRVRGGTLYDFLHLTAASISGANTLYTLNTRHFEAVARAGDPDIKSPG